MKQKLEIQEKNINLTPSQAEEKSMEEKKEERNQIAINLAKKFHRYYEELAPQYGYETREETREFNPDSKNGKLMIAVCERILANLVI